MSRAPEAPLPAERFADLLAGRTSTFGLTLDAGTLSGMAAYLAELDRWRQTTNLTGRLSPEELSDHALEALVASPLIADGERVADIGSGAGFPGLPLAIGRPRVAFTLIEPRGKRAAFLRHAVRALGLQNTTVLEARIEKVGGQTFDAATTRAVGGFDAWMGDAGFLSRGGRLLAWTTDPAAVSSELGPRFRLGRDVPIPGSRVRRIAVFERVA
jgi:16S rRNA (guanine527-N7)-methyltransferase